MKMKMKMNNDCNRLITSNLLATDNVGPLRALAFLFGSQAAGRGLKSSFLIGVASLLVLVLLAATPLRAQNLGLTIDQLIERLGKASNAAGVPLEFKKLSCIENEKPGNPDEKIVSCSHMLGSGRLLISNSEPEGPVIDIATQPWDGSENGPGAMMITWIAAAINNGDPAQYGPAANTLVKATASRGSGDATIERVNFVVLDLGGKLTITAHAK